MTRDALARLTDGQRDVLRMVDRHMETKEIARELGISPDGVNQRIKAAMRILGVSKRRDAARMLAEAEGEERYQPLVYPPRDIVPEPDPAMLDPSAGRERDPYPLPGGAMREPQAAFEVAPQLRTKRLRLPLPIWGGRPSDLNAVQRLSWIFAVIVAVALAFGIFVAGMEALSRLGRAGS